jgi:hypothetical protein
MRNKEWTDKGREGNDTLKGIVYFNNTGANTVIAAVLVLLPEIKLYMDRVSGLITHNLLDSPPLSVLPIMFHRLLLCDGRSVLDATQHRQVQQLTRSRIPL